MFEKVLFCTFSAAFLMQLFYYCFFYIRIAFYGNKTQKQKQEKRFPVSVVICAQNEEKNLREFLPQILEQDYPDFEVIVVNHCSDDNSEALLYELKRKYPRLYYTNIVRDEKFRNNKKLALTIGIKAAKNEWLLLTDADCRPAGKSWLSNMQEHFTDDKEIVLGYGTCLRKKGLLNRLIRFETFFTGIQYLSFALAGIPYMGVGRNLAYRKSLFFKNKGFSAHYYLNSGDADLFVNKNATRKNTSVNIHVNSITHSVPETTFKHWILQKQRHFLTFKYYKWKHKLLLGGEIFSRFLYFTSFISLIINDKYIQAVLMAFALRLLLQGIVFFKAAKILNEKNLFYFYFLFEIVVSLINFKVYFSRFFRKSKFSWR